MRRTNARPAASRADWYRLLLAVAVCLTVGVVGVRLMSDSQAAELPRLPWPSGITVGPPSQVSAWENFRGTKVGAIHGFAARSNWNEVESAGWIMGYYKNSPELLVISQPFWPEGIGGSMGACAGGSYDANWKRYGTMLENSGRKDRTVTRLAWEFNGNWFQWSAHNPEQWKSCWRKVVTAVRSTAPGAKFEWAMNAHGSQTSGGDAWNSYPGNEYVDLVGIDPYDHYPPSPTAAKFDEQCNDKHGLCYVAKYARQHGKKVGVGEWAVMHPPSRGGGGAGDNPVYMQKMYETFYEYRDVMGYETYFNEERYGNALVNPTQNPQSAAKYKELWGPNSPAIKNPQPQPGGADLNRDGKVDITDLSRLLTAWGKPDADLNGDGTTGIADLSRLLTAWSR